MNRLLQPPDGALQPRVLRRAVDSAGNDPGRAFPRRGNGRNGRRRAAVLTILFAVLFPVQAMGAPASTRGSESVVEGRTDPAQASIVLIGTGATPELERLIGELLAHQQIRARFSLRTAFDAARLFDDESNDARLRVFIEVKPDRQDTHLYFRGPSGKRFLLRSIPLPNGLDDVGRELIAQVVESSVDALLNSSSGMDREQAQTQLIRERTPAPSQPGASDSSSAIRSGTAKSWLFWLQLRYTLLDSGPSIGWAQGPGVELALGNAARFGWRARFTIEHYFMQTLPSDDVAVDLDNNALRLSLDLVIPMGGTHYIVPSLGVGPDVTRIRPSRIRSDVRPGDSKTRFGVTGRPEVRYEFLHRSLSFGVAGFFDLALSNIRYDLIDGAERATIAIAWRLRPGAAAVAGIRF